MIVSPCGCPVARLVGLPGMRRMINRRPAVSGVRGMFVRRADVPCQVIWAALAAAQIPAVGHSRLQRFQRHARGVEVHAGRAVEQVGLGVVNPLDPC